MSRVMWGLEAAPRTAKLVDVVLRSTATNSAVLLVEEDRFQILVVVEVLEDDDLVGGSRQDHVLDLGLLLQPDATLLH